MKLTDEQKLLAAQAVRQFRAGGGMDVFTAHLEDYRRACYGVLHKPAANMTPAQYAEASGAVRTVDKVFEIFKQIEREADELNRE